MRRRWFMATVIAALMVAACSSNPTPEPSGPAASGPATSGPATSTPASSPSAPQGQSGGSIVWAYNFPPKSSWAVETDDAVTLLMAGVGETLTRVDNNGQLQPSLATKWERTGDTTWDFTLRDGVTFQDGTPFNADAVATALTHVLQAKAPARSFGPSTFASVEAVSNSMVRITTTAPDAIVPLNMASANTLILANKAYAGDQIDPVGTGTGPFTITKMDLPQSITLARNDSYWGDKPLVAGAEVRFVPDGNTRVALLESGEAQIISAVPVPAIPVLDGDSNVKVDSAPAPRTASLYLNNSRAPFDNVKFRQAIQSAIDVNAIANDVLEGAATPASGIFAANAPFAPSGAQPVQQNLDQAKSLLASAGIDPTQVSVSLWTYTERSELPDVAVALQRMLQALGISVDVRVANYSALEPDLLSGNFDMLVLSRSYMIDVNDVSGFLASDYGCKGGYNLSHFCDPSIDTQIAAAAQNPDASARNAVYQQIAAKLQAEAVDVFLYQSQTIYGVSSHVQGFSIHPLDRYVLTPGLSLGG